MSESRADTWFQTGIKVVVVLFLVAAGTGTAALIAAKYVVGELASALAAPARPNPDAAEKESSAETQERAETVELDFLNAIGITRTRLESLLSDRQAALGELPLEMMLTLQSDDGEFLVDGEVNIRWNSGRIDYRMRKSGRLLFHLKPEHLNGLRIVVPKSHPNVRQRSIPFGDGYVSDETEFTGFGGPVIDDHKLHSKLRRELGRFAKVYDSPEVVPPSFRSDDLNWRLPLPSSSSQELTPHEIHAARRDSVVLVGHLQPDGHLMTATGVVLDSSGIVATAAHVIDKPEAIARGLITADGEVHRIVRVLLSDRVTDLALVKTDASNLKPAPISSGAKIGTAVTIIAHPGRQNYCVTHGIVSRYFVGRQYGETAALMAVTADIADGSSGGPVFDRYGRVTGIVSATFRVRDQMVSRFIAPIESLRRLAEGVAIASSETAN